MNIESIKLIRFLFENLDAIYRSTGRRIIEFTRSDFNRIVLILGKNGVGKSFLINEINPSPLEAVDNRRCWRIIPEEDGRKEMDFLVNGRYMYRLRIYYSGKGRTTTAYIERENIESGEKLELNPNGNVRSYMDIVEQELGYSKQYINIGYLSDSVTNMIKMKPVERNEYISNFMPSITEPLDAFSVVQKKFNINKRQIATLDMEIGKIIIGDYDNEQARLLRLRNSLDEEIDSVNNNISKGETYLSIINNSLTLRDIQSSTNNLTKTGINLQKESDELNHSISELKNYQGKQGEKLLEKDIITCDMKIQELKTNILTEETNVLRLQKQLEETRGTTSVSSTQIDKLPEINSFLDNLTEELGTLEKALKNHTKSALKSIGIVDAVNPPQLDEYFEIMAIMRNFYNDITNQVTDTKLRMGVTKYAQELNEQALGYRNHIDRIQKEIDNRTSRISNLKNHGLDENILSLKRSDCKPTNCNLLQELQKYFKPDLEILRIESELMNYYTERSNVETYLEDTMENIKHAERACEIVVNLNNYLFEKRTIISFFPKELSDFFKNTVIEDMILNIPYMQDQVDELKEVRSVINKMNTIRTEIESYTNQKERIALQMLLDNKSKEFLSEYERCNNNRVHMISERNRMTDRKQELENIKILQNSLNERVVDLNGRVAAHDRILIDQKKLVGNWYQDKHIRDAISRFKNKKENLLKERAEINLQYERLQTSKISRDSLEKSRNNLLEKQQTYQVLMDTWSPRIGFPALMIQEFLEEIRIKTNKDLMDIWNGVLQIEKFIISNNEFSIVINKEDPDTKFRVLINDASECSGSERAMISMTLSLAIIETAMESPYKLLRMDETDAALDPERRRTFMGMILDRLESMSCFDCFVITHNGEVETISADVILLPGYDRNFNLSNKKIIMDIS